MNTNPKKIKRNDSKISIAQKRIRNENEKRRRDLFSQLITNLGDVILNKNDSQTNKFSKNFILRQTVTYLQQHKNLLNNQSKLFLSASRPTNPNRSDILNISWKPSSDIVTTEEWFQIAIESMNCFLLIVKDDLFENKIVHVSKNISNCLGYSQDEIENRTLYEFIRLSDHQKLNEYFKNKHQILKQCEIYWRQSTSNDYEQCTIIGAFRQINENENNLIAIVKVNTVDRTLIMHNDNHSQELITHINNNGRFIFVNSKTREFLGYNSYELIGRTFFDFVHPDDLTILTRAHNLWKTNGNGKSDPYRFLTKGQQWIFIQTYSQVQINSWTGKPDYYICTTYIIQCSTDSLQKQLSTASANPQNFGYSSLDGHEMLLSADNQEKSSAAQNEIKSFLSDLNNDNNRKNIRDKLMELRKNKQTQIRLRQEEIQVIDDILLFIGQYHIKQSNTNINQDYLLNMFEKNNDNELFNIPIDTNVIEDYTIESNSKDDPLQLLLTSPLTPFANPSTTDQTQQHTINYFPTTTTIDKTFIDHSSPK